MNSSDTFVSASSKLARALLLTRNKSAAARLDNAFRRNISAFGFDATRLLAALGVPYRSYVSHRYIPGRVVVIAASSWENDIPNAEVVSGLLARGGTAILQGDALPELTSQARVVRFEPPLYPPSDEIEYPPDALDMWANKLCDIAEAIAIAL